MKTIFVIILSYFIYDECQSINTKIDLMGDNEVIKAFPKLYNICPEQALSIPCFLPLKDFKNTYFSSGYGVRKHPISGIIKHHNGIDIASPKKDVIATGTGIIKTIGYSDGLGYFIIIDHQNTYETTYGHLSNIFVKKGQKVNIFDSIGIVGNSGASKGYHIHYEIRKKGTLINPIHYLLLLYDTIKS